jgi:DNA (cytosine-5)-methyltransferase 1
VIRPPILRAWSDSIIADNFAGGGGASSGIEAALGRSPDIAINHDPEAIAMHRANHPDTRHFVENVWKVDPAKACGGKPVALAWFSPTCTHFSKAKGSPLDESSIRIRGLAWVAVRWAAAVRPRVICIENVEEFRDWGPLDRATNQPIASRKGQTYRAFRRKLERLGYVVEDRILRACDYGAPTTRKRLFLVATCDGRLPRWPTPTHGPLAVPYRTAAECIDWSVPAQSIFDRDKPLAEKTLARVHRGLKTFVLEARDPFVVTGEDGRPFVPYLVHRSNGERVGQAPRIYDVRKPLGTVVAQGEKHALCVAFLAKHYGGNESTRGGSALDKPIDTITTVDHHSLVTAFLIRYNGTSVGQSLCEPLSTIDTHDRFGLVTVTIRGQAYRVDDIAMRMLTPRELYRAQGFGDEYRIDPEWNGKPLSKTAQVRMCGNSVCPPIAAAVVRAQLEAA